EGLVAEEDAAGLLTLLTREHLDELVEGLVHQPELEHLRVPGVEERVDVRLVDLTGVERLADELLAVPLRAEVEPHAVAGEDGLGRAVGGADRKSTRLN